MEASKTYLMNGWTFTVEFFFGMEILVDMTK